MQEFTFTYLANSEKDRAAALAEFYNFLQKIKKLKKRKDKLEKELKDINEELRKLDVK